MRTGVSYMGHHNPRHLRSDLEDLRKLGCDDVLLAAQENDFVHFTGKLTFLPAIARENGLRPLAIFWGALNLFGGGRSSQFLLERPEGRQVRRDGSPAPQGCYNNPACMGQIQRMIDRVAELGFEGYFVDEPTPIDCWCPACRELFAGTYGGSMLEADAATVAEFRRLCVINYIEAIGRYVKQHHAAMETMCCLMPVDKDLWKASADIKTLDNLGTDIYWVNDKRDVEEMTPIVRDLAGVCARTNKKHHEWLQAWQVRKGNEPRIIQQGEILIREQPDALYIWAYLGQIGTTESCDDPLAAWAAASEVLRRAKQV